MKAQKNILSKIFLTVLVLGLFGCAAPDPAAPVQISQISALTNAPAMSADTIVVPATKDRPALTKKEVDEWMALSLSVMLTTENIYVNPVEREVLMRNAMNGMLSQLDSFSEFFSPEDFKILNSGTSGQFGGIGVEVMARDKGGVSIMAPIEGTPAYEAGLLPGDFVTNIDGTDVTKADMMTITRLMRGEPDTAITVTVSRAQGSRKKDFTFGMKRAIINIESVPDARILDEEAGIAYVRIATFDKNMVSELGKNLKKLKASGMKALVIDLRNNGGGLLDAAKFAAEYFVPKEALIVSTIGRVVGTNEFKSAKAPEYEIPLAVLVNGATASAAEILAGALRCQCDATLVGDKTFGKGSVQNVAPVGKDGCGMKVTIAHYYTPDGVCIHKKGLKPDVEIRVSEDEEEALREERRLERRLLFENKDAKLPLSETDRALKAALTLLKKQL